MVRTAFAVRHFAVFIFIIIALPSLLTGPAFAQGADCHTDCRAHCTRQVGNLARYLDPVCHNTCIKERKLSRDIRGCPKIDAWCLAALSTPQSRSMIYGLASGRFTGQISSKRECRNIVREHATNVIPSSLWSRLGGGRAEVCLCNAAWSVSSEAADAAERFWEEATTSEPTPSPPRSRKRRRNKRDGGDACYVPGSAGGCF